ncbi:MAG TPA: hypothetical protein VNW53_06875 [Phenylobacterium sp.]|jgi:hypothetical protein|uniref:hypothetical protein n=1 Tax=Phenylobacterium sp. TaxID=1871053 RepID=UPI002C6A628A|nr:hypothetical protein [Phenylobacterium sp.]HXA38705.1 hypothetical protein [Phenylobacterium sp.]
MKLVSLARRLGVAILATAALAGPAAAQAPSYDGDWAGTLEAGGQKLRLELHLKTVGGQETAILDSLDQGASIPATAVKTDGGELSALFLAVGGELKAKLSPDGKTLAGTWTQGATLPLTMTRK